MMIVSEKKKNFYKIYYWLLPRYMLSLYIYKDNVIENKDGYNNGKGLQYIFYKKYSLPATLKLQYNSIVIRP